MPLVSITEAAKMADLSRPYFHEAYLRTGKISVDRSDPKKPKIDTSELLRIFGKLKVLQNNSQQEDTTEHTLQLEYELEIRLELERLRTENDGLRRLSEERLTHLHEKDSLLADTKQEISYYRERIHGLEVRYDRLIENKKPVQEEAKTVFWKRIKALFSS
jgi:hypothetical protein